MRSRQVHSSFAQRTMWVSLSLILICAIATVLSGPERFSPVRFGPKRSAGQASAASRRAAAGKVAASVNGQFDMTNPRTSRPGSDAPPRLPVAPDRTEASQSPRDEQHTAANVENSGTAGDRAPRQVTSRPAVQTRDKSESDRPRVFVETASPRSASARTAPVAQRQPGSAAPQRHESRSQTADEPRTPAARPVQTVERLQQSEPRSAPANLTRLSKTVSKTPAEQVLAQPHTADGPAAQTPSVVTIAPASIASQRELRLEASLMSLQNQLQDLSRKYDVSRKERFEAARDQPQAAAPTVDHRMEAMFERMESRIDQLAQNQSMQTLQQQQLQQLELLQKQLQMLREGAEPSAVFPQLQQATPAANGTQAPGQAPTDVEQPEAEPAAQPVLRIEQGQGGEGFTLTIQDTELQQVFEMFAELSGKNIVVGTSVAGKVSATLHNVSVDEAIEAVLRAHGLVAEREEKFIYISTAAEAEAQRRLRTELVTRVFRPQYISAADLQTLLTPFITEEVGKIAVTTAAESGLALDSATAGGDRLIQEDAVLVQDYADVIEQIEKVIIEMDQPPMQVVIEAMIMTVTLTDEFKFGVNFALINDTAKSLTLSGNGQVLNNAVGWPPKGSNSGSVITPPGGDFLANTAGLKYGLIAGDITMFIDALESITDTNLIASPQLRVINKQKAELIIGNRLGYTTVTNNGTTSIESANFLDVGTKLIFRPFISKDGMVRMEVHPERSSGAINDQTGLPDTQTTEVTTNIMVRDGSTVVIGGLIEEQVNESVSRVPLLGALPVVGPAFQNKRERVDRTELIVLITPRIVRETEAVPEAEEYLYENERRREHFKDELSPINRLNLTRMHYERAEHHLALNQLDRAEYHARHAARISKNDQRSLELLHYIQSLQPWENKRWWEFWKRDRKNASIAAPDFVPSSDLSAEVRHELEMTSPQLIPADGDTIETMNPQLQPLIPPEPQQ